MPKQPGDPAHIPTIQTVKDSNDLLSYAMSLVVAEEKRTLNVARDNIRKNENELNSKPENKRGQ